MDPLSLAVIGAGYWGRKVIREITSISQRERSIKLHSIVDNSPTSLEACRQEFGPLDYRLDYQTLLSDKTLSAVHICTPNPFHFEIASAFIKAGKNVLLEKPITLKSREAYALAELAQDNKIVLSAGHIHRFNNGVRELKRALATGVLGTPYYFRLEWTGFMPPQGQREVITDLAPHPFDICNYLTGQWPTKISCRAKGYRTRDREEVAFISCEYEDGLVAHIEVSWLDPEKRRKVTVVAKEGIGILDCLEQKAVLQQRDHTEQVPIIPSNTLREELLHFAGCVNHNGQSETFENDSDGLLGAHVVTCLEAARDSLLKEKTVPVQFPLFREIPARR
jgi:UDP-N-acetylglucosamine 3-dehydrogenase